MEKAAVYLVLRIILPLQGKKKESVNKISADKSFALSTLGRCSKAVRLTFCIELQLPFSFACCFLLLAAGSHLKLFAFERVQLLMLK